MQKKLIIVLLIVGYILIIKYLFFHLLPFLLAFLVYFLIKPFIECIERKCHIKRNAIGIALLLSVYLIFIIILVFIIIYALIYFFHFIQNIPYLYEFFIEPSFSQIMTWLEQQFPYVTQQDLITFIYEYSGQIIAQIMSLLPSLFSHVPFFFFSFFLFMIATFFLVLEYDLIKDKFINLLPKKIIQLFFFIKNNCIHSFIVYVKCQFILIFICFFVLWIVFMILRIKHPFIVAISVSLLDSLPFIGIGIVLIPLSIYFIFQGYYLKAIYVFLIYLIMNIMRSFLEPHIMNKNMQIPSFLLLLSMVIHLYFFGMIGVILSPIHMNILYGMLEYKE